MNDQLQNLAKSAIQTLLMKIVAAPFDRVCFEIINRDSPVPTIGQGIKDPGIFSTLQRIRHREGYRGWWSTLWEKLLVGAWRSIIESNLDTKATFYMDKAFFHPGLFMDAYFRGVLSRILISLVDYPMNFVMTKYMTQVDLVRNTFKFNSFLETFNYISEREGILAVYSGYHYYLIDEMISSVAFTMFEWLDQKVTPTKPLVSGLSVISLFAMIIVLLVPLETALFHLPLLCGENIEMSVGEILRGIYQREGFGGWYKLMLPRILRCL